MRRRDFIFASGATVAWPIKAHAQQPAMPVVGWIVEVPAAEPRVIAMVAAFRQGMAELGYVEGKNFAFEGRFRPESLPQASADLVRLNVNAIFAAAAALAAVSKAALAAVSKATTSIPVVGVDLESDPIAKGYVKSLARPGGNITGMFLDIPELSGKQVGLLKEIVSPAISHSNLWRPRRTCLRSSSARLSSPTRCTRRLDYPARSCNGRKSQFAAAPLQSSCEPSLRPKISRHYSSGLRQVQWRHHEGEQPGTTRGSLRRSRTAKASRISRHAVKLRCACEWGGWGRLSQDGPGHYNPDLSKDPWGGGLITLQGGARSNLRPDTVQDNRCDDEVHEGRCKLDVGRRMLGASSSC